MKLSVITDDIIIIDSTNIKYSKEHDEKCLNSTADNIITAHLPSSITFYGQGNEWLKILPTTGNVSVHVNKQPIISMIVKTSTDIDNLWKAIHNYAQGHLDMK